MFQVPKGPVLRLRDWYVSMRVQNQLAAAQRAGDLAAQLEHSLHVADTRIGMAKSPSDREHWRCVHRECEALIAESGFHWRGGRLVDPNKPVAKAKSFAKAAGSRAGEFQALRGGS